MPIETVGAFFDSLREWRLLEPSQLEELSRDAEGRFAQPGALAQELLQRGWLTSYQISQLIDGRVEDLALGPYLLLERLGEGGMGQVFKGRHLRMKRTVAVKVIRKERLAQVDAERRFFREVEAAARLVHPNIVLAFDADEVNGVHYFAMEYVEGVDLARLVKQNGPLPTALACDYVRQASLGLQHAHEQGLVHRDIKPANLLVTANGSVVKILDLGLARLMEVQPGDSTSNELTQTGVVMGTPDYLAPEQALNPRDADIRADIYSLGCTLYFLIAGHPPFPSGALMEKLIKHREAEPTPIEELRPELPRGLGPLLRRLMAKAPENRFQTPAAVAEAILPFCDLAGFGSGTSATMMVERGRLAALPDAIEPYALDMPTQSIVAPTVATDWSPQTPGPSVRQPSLAPPTAKPSERPQTFVLLLAVAVGIAGLVGYLTWGLMAAVFSVVIVLMAAAIPRGWRSAVIVQAPGPDAEVSVDKQRVTLDARSAARVELSPGQHTLVVNRHGEELLRRSFRLRGGGEAFVTVLEVPVIIGELRRFMGHAPGVLSVAFTPDGRRAVSGGKDKTVRLWDIRTGRELRCLEGHTFDVSSVAVSPNGSLILSASGRLFQGTDMSPRLWDLETGQELRRFDGHSEAVLSVAFSPSGRRALSAGLDRTARLWEVETGKELRRLEGHAGAITGVAFSPDGRQAMTGGLDRIVRLWDLSTQAEIRSFEGHAGAILCLAASSDGRRLLSGSLDQTARLWDIDTGEELRRLDGHAGAVMSVAFSPDGRRALSANGMHFRDHQWTAASEYCMRQWDLETGRELRRFELSRGFRSVTFSPDGRRALSGGYGEAVRLWGLP